MLDVTRTTTALLAGLRDRADEAAWTHIDSRYRPILIGLGRRFGLSDADAADMAQETLLAFMEQYTEGRYDRDRGRLRSWLLSIARTRIAMVHRKRSVRKEQAGVTSVAEGLEDDVTLAQAFEEERRRHLLHEAMEELRRSSRTADNTMQAFELVAMRGMPASAVAEQLGMSVDDVYRAKSRVAQRLREIVERMELAYEGDV